MTTLAYNRPSSPARSGWRLLVLIELFIAANALGGSIYGLTGAKGVPREWLEGSPFESFIVPSLVLLVAVAGGMTAAALALMLRHKRAAEISIGAGVILLGWIVVQVIIIPFSWLQPVFFAGGLTVIALGWRMRNRRISAAPAVRASAGTRTSSWVVPLSRAAHALVTGLFLSCIALVYVGAWRGEAGPLTLAAVGALFGEGALVVLCHGNCPLGPLLRRLGDDKPLFELVLPPRAAALAVPVLGGVTVLGVILLVVRTVEVGG